jgi:cell division protein FtsI/penicillin-binding protein 2
MRGEYVWRSLVIAGLLGLVALSVIVQMVRIQNSPEALIFREQSALYGRKLETFHPERGAIYDRNGRLLAGSKTVYEVGVDLATVRDPEAIAAALGIVLGEDPGPFLEAMTNPPEGLRYLVLRDFVEAEAAKQLNQLIQSAREMAEPGRSGRLQGLALNAHPQREYPEGALGSNVVGFVSYEGRGYFGVEEKYNSLLAGNAVQVWIPTDPNRAIEIPQVPGGTTLVLTIDRQLQAAVEEALDDALDDYGAAHGTIVVMDPLDGAILALASSPRMNLNDFGNYGIVYSNASEFNRAVSMPYEPGSVLKVLTMAAALDSGTVVPSTPFLDTGSIQAGGAIIRNWNDEAWGPQDMVGCMQHSLNVCLAWVAERMGADTFYAYMTRFGFGHPTGVDLAGEAAGRLKVPGDSDWYPVDLATNAFGQGISVTPMQMLMAVSAVANDGRMVVPHVLHAMVRDGRQYSVPAQFAGSPISPETAKTLTEMLAASLEQESSSALVPGYRVAGKTGTAQIPGPYGYEYGATNASFIGWGPLDDPQFMIYVWLERPSTSIWGSETAAPTFARVAQDTILVLNIAPDSVRNEMANR